MTETMTPKLASAASIAGMTPGRRTISPSDAVATGSAVSLAPEMCSEITFGSGRTVSTSAQATSDIPAAASQGTVNVSAETSLPAKSGPKTAGPKMAPNTAPKSTSEIPLALRSGGYMSPAAVRMSRVTAPETPIRTKPAMTASPESQFVPAAVSTQPADPSRKPVAITGTRPTRSKAEERLDPGHEHERQREDGRAQLEYSQVDRHDRRQDRRVAADVEVLGQRSSRLRPARNSDAP